MLALSPLRTSNAEDREADGGFSVDDEDLLDNIDFSGIFEGFGFGGDHFPELELSESHNDTLSQSSAEGREPEVGPLEKPERGEKSACMTPATPVLPESRKATARSSHGKKKAKVDWTPELHRRFVMAVEELGVDKAVPSRILEIMGSHNLTRHNIASHLQKYRSQRKHSLARGAEGGSWSHQLKIYAAAASAGVGHNGTAKKENRQWISPTVGFPSLQPPFRPLHVWGHPAFDQSPLMRATWQGQTAPFQSPCPPWPQPPNYIAYWQPHFHRGSGEGWGPPSAVFQAPHCIPQPIRREKVTPPPNAGAPHQLYRLLHWFPALSQHQPEQNAQPSKESIDDVIAEVLAKPLLPLPLGLKPPSIESVMGELQRQGVSTPGCSADAK